MCRAKKAQGSADSKHMNSQPWAHQVVAANADGLSRLPLKEEPGEEGDTQASCFYLGQIQASCFYLGQIQALPITSEQLGVATCHDPDLSKVMRYTLSRDG